MWLLGFVIWTRVYYKDLNFDRRTRVWIQGPGFGYGDQDLDTEPGF